MARRIPDNYVNVPARIAMFRKDHPEGSIHTNKREVEGHPEVVEVKAMVFRNRDEIKLYGETGIATATGIAQTFGIDEVEKGVEKLESVAIGRALANLGYSAVDDDRSEEVEEEAVEEQKVEEEKEEIVDVKSKPTSRFKSRFQKQSAEASEEETEAEEEKPKSAFGRKPRFQRN